MGADAAAEEQFGPYLVYERLGVGGMATVHRALERGIEGFERIVALKRLLPHLAEDASFIKSFVREAKLASLLNHVNIVQIFELGRVGTEYFISMEYIDGRDIRRILRHARKVTGPPPIHVTVGLLLQLCDALDYAHTQGRRRRRIRSASSTATSRRRTCWSRRAGHLKVIDFGIAKAQSSQLRTQTGRVKGKLAYMAPEAIAGKELDARSDLFAAGVIAHELLTARPLFASKNEYQTLMKVQRGDIMPPSTFNQACPPELDAIVLRALARDPDERFRDAERAARRAASRCASSTTCRPAIRDIATWLDWAFCLEAPARRLRRRRHDRPRASAELDARAARAVGRRAARDAEDDEAVEIAWGGGESQSNGEPVVLDDVPDVSEKHLASASALGAEVRLDLDDLADDIPTPLPSHGAGRRRHATAPLTDRGDRVPLAGAPRAQAADRCTPARRADRLRRRAARPTQSDRRRSAHARDTGVTIGRRFGLGGAQRAMPPRVRTITMPRARQPVVDGSAHGPVAIPPTRPPIRACAAPPPTRVGVSRRWRSTPRRRPAMSDAAAPATSVGGRMPARRCRTARAPRR